VAANYYFNKDVSELTLTESAALAAITNNPTKYNPLTENGAEQNEKRRRLVLDKMLELGYITYDEYDKAYNEKLKLDDSQEDDYEIEINSYFVDALIDQV
ncbi:MAG TPA: penicillin-binding protein, partial [Ruminococcaceae bacterium]|nr:penicillin-binding protein [Oscillospiraceae bacterium]